MGLGSAAVSALAAAEACLSGVGGMPWMCSEEETLCQAEMSINYPGWPVDDCRATPGSSLEANFQGFDGHCIQQ